MPENIRALIVIAGLAFAVFWATGKALAGTHTTPQDFRRRRNLWLAITFIAFTSPNYWLFIVASAAVIIVGRTKEQNSLALFFALVFVAPQIAGRIPGFGIVNYLFDIDIVRLLSFLVLFPAYLVLRRRSDTPPFGSLLPDKLLIGFIVVLFAVRTRETTVTDALRSGLLYPLLEGFLPYYVASRACLNMRRYGDALFSFVVATLLLAAIATFEFSKRWLLYNSLGTSLAGAEFWGWGYLPRETSLRAVASAGQPIPLGVVLTTGIAFLLYLKSRIKNRTLSGIALLLLCTGLVATLSRGPWVAAIAMILAFSATSPRAFSNLFKATFIGAICSAALLVSPLGPRVISLIPFVGDVEPQNAEYRRDFIEASIPVILERPFFGTPDFEHLAVFEPLRPQGLLDTLNVFIGVALGSGLVGLALFSGVFLYVLIGVFRAMRRVQTVNDELYLAGRSMFAALVGFFVAINTISNILVIPLLYWSLCGIGLGYVLLVQRALASREIGNSQVAKHRGEAIGRPGHSWPRGSVRTRVGDN